MSEEFLSSTKKNIDWHSCNREEKLVQQIITRGVYDKKVPGTQEYKRDKVCQDLQSLELFRGHVLDQKNIDRKYKDLAKKTREHYQVVDDAELLENFNKIQPKSTLDKLILDIEEDIASTKANTKAEYKQKADKKESLDKKAHDTLKQSGNDHISKHEKPKHYTTKSSTDSSSPVPKKETKALPLEINLLDDDEATAHIINTCKQTMQLEQLEKIESIKLREIEQQRLLKMEEKLEAIDCKYQKLKRKYKKLKRNNINISNIDSSSESE